MSRDGVASFNKSEVKEIKLEKTMKISVVGIGKLGLCFALTLERAGYNILGVDLSPDYIRAINEKTLISSEPGVTNMLRSASNFSATTSVEAATNHSNIIFVVVATPSLPTGRYDHTQIDELVDVLEGFGKQKEKKHFVVCCTTMPGYCDSIKKRLNKLNYVVSYNPEFIAQGTILRDQANPDMVLIGEGSVDAGDVLEEIYERHTENNPRICRMSPKEAEIAKISLNCFLTTKIAYANMIGDVTLAAGGNPHKVLKAIGEDSRIGNKYLGYGFGYGGPCFPRDNRALAAFAGDIGVAAAISLASDSSNKDHLKFQVNRFFEKTSKKEEITFKYVTYKPESTLLTESQQLAYAVAIATEGYTVKIVERKEVLEELREKYGNLFIYQERNDD